MARDLRSFAIALSVSAHGTGRMIPLTRLAALAATLAPALGQCLIGVEQNPNQAINPMYGSYIESSSGTIVIGHRGFGGSRRAILWERQGGRWAITGDLVAGPINSSYSTPVAIDGATVLVGSFGESADSGRVYVHERVLGTFQLAQVLLPATSRPDSHFGRRLEIDGDRMAIAAPMDDTSTWRGGAVFVFERGAGGWLETARIDPPVSHTLGFFGLGLALGGNTLAVADKGSNAVRVYGLQGQSWVLEQTLPATGSGFGYDMAIDGETLFVGADRESVTGSGGYGAVHVYRRQAGVWVDAQVLSIPATVSGSAFGQTVKWSEGRLLVGGGSAELGGGYCPVFVFEEVGGAFVLSKVIEQEGLPYAGFGTAVTSVGNEVWVGHPFTRPNISATYDGTLYRFSIADLVPRFCEPIDVNSTGQRGALAGEGCPTFERNDLSLVLSGLPGGSFAIPVIGPEAGFVPGVLGGLGTLCVGGALARGAVLQASASGEGAIPFDVMAILGSTGPITGSAGETWYAQVVYRDTGMPTTTRTTNAVAIELR